MSAPVAELPNMLGAERHPLQTEWSFWYDQKLPRGSPASAYKNNLRRLGTFDTVEEFWRHYIYLKRPSELEKDVNVYLFRKQLTPMWETFPNGGCWILKVRNKSGAVSQLWQDLVFAAIGEVFEEPGLVGVVLAMRSRDSYLAVWHADNATTRTRFLIGERLKSVLQLEPSTVIEYKAHKESMKDGSTFRNAQAYVFAQRSRSRAPSVSTEDGAGAGGADEQDGGAEQGKQASAATEQ